MSNVTADTAIRTAGTHFQQGRHDEAFAEAQKALRARPGDPVALTLMGVITMGKGKLDEAEAYLRQALVTAPNSSDVHCNLGLIYAGRRDHQKALTSFQTALNHNASHVESWLNAGSLLLALGRLEEATACTARAQQVASSRPDVLKELGRNLLLGGRAMDAGACFMRAAEIERQNPLPRMQALLSTNYISELEPAVVFEEHKRFGEWFGAAATKDTPTFSNSRDPARKLRVGLVSPDIRSHSCASFMLPMVAKLPRDQFEVYLYSQVDSLDATGQKIKSLGDAWRVTARQGGAQIAQQARTDNVDVLIDLAGHTYGSRLDAFLHRGAPVQMTYLGYPNTTGVPTIGYRLVDAVTDPDGAEALATEKLLRIEGCFLCFEPREELKNHAPVERTPGEPFTFGVFTGLPKISNACIEAWGQILSRAPGSRLLLKSQYLSDKPTWARIEAAFQKAGAPAGSVVPLEFTPSLAEHYNQHSKVDVVLDTFPYNGTTTTCEQLWLGVPVLTFRGDRHAARVGASLLGAAGLSEFVADSREQYIEKAVAMAADPARVRGVRSGLRDRLKSSPLMDADGFGKRFGAAIRAGWRDWCSQAT